MATTREYKLKMDKKNAVTQRLKDQFIQTWSNNMFNATEANGIHGVSYALSGVLRVSKFCL